LRPLLGPDEGGEVDTRLLKRDKVARAVLHSFMGRIARDDPAAARLWDNVVYAGVHFAFEPVYAASHPAVAESLVEFFSTADIPACDESEAAFRRHFDALMEKWRARVTRKSSSMYFGILLRHVGPDAANRLYQEFAGMDANERVDLLSRTKGYEELSRASREVAVGALLDPSMEVREAAYELLESLAAPVGEFDASSRDEDIEKSLPGLRRWAAETKS